MPFIFFRFDSLTWKETDWDLGLVGGLGVSILVLPSVPLGVWLRDNVTGTWGQPPSSPLLFLLPLCEVSSMWGQGRWTWGQVRRTWFWYFCTGEFEKQTTQTQTRQIRKHDHERGFFPRILGKSDLKRWRHPLWRLPSYFSLRRGIYINGLPWFCRQSWNVEMQNQQGV